jgi:hypothetical protein
MSGGVLENRVLNRIFGLKREEDGLWRKLHNDELPYRDRNRWGELDSPGSG